MASRASSLDFKTLFPGDAARGVAPLSDVELRQLRVFCVVVAAGGFSAATAELQSDLSTISRQFKELEGRVGARLAVRGRSGFALTQSGQRFHGLAQTLLNAMQRFSEETTLIADDHHAVLRLGVVDALLSAPFSPIPVALASCVDAIPGLSLQLSSLRPIDIERRILADELDAGIMAAHPPAAGLGQQRLYAEVSSLYVAPGHPWHAADAQGLTLGALSTIPVVMDPFSVDLPFANFSPAKGSARSDSIEGSALLVATGRFAAFLPDHFVQSTSRLSLFKPVRPDLFSYAQDIVVCSKSGTATLAVRKLLHFLSVAGREHPSPVVP